MPTETYYPHFLPGRGRKSANAKHGIVHAVRHVHGDNFTASRCGVRPTGKSLGWIETSRAITCQQCAEPDGGAV